MKHSWEELYGNNSENSLISQCYNSGNIEGAKKWIGGICGYNGENSSIQECYNIGEINGNNAIGGISGRNQGNIFNVYNIGRIEAEENVGGIIGENVGNLENAYNIGYIPNINSGGGIVGKNYKLDEKFIGNINNTYSLNSVINRIYGINETNIRNSMTKNESDLKNITSILGNSFKNDVNNINNGYPILTWQRDPTMG